MVEILFWLPLILWMVWNVNFIRWFIDSLKRKVNYEIAMSIATELFFTTLFLNYYLNPLIPENFILQLIGFSLMWFGFFFLFLYQRYLLKSFGEGPPEDYEDTTVLITSGWFKLMRHPMFFCAILMNLSTLLVKITILSFILVPFSVGLCILSAHWEEKLNIQKFGVDYLDYMKKVKRWGII